MASNGPSQSLSGTIASEKALVEGPAIDLLVALGWNHANLMQEAPGPQNPTGRLRETILPGRLRVALRRLNLPCRMRPSSRPRSS